MLIRHINKIFHRRFPNGACMSSSAGKNGTCYAQDECENKGGTGYGSCAGGYGVCCVCKKYCFTLSLIQIPKTFNGLILGILS